MGSKKSSVKPVVALLLASAGLVAGLFAYVKFSPAARVPEAERRTVASESKTPSRPHKVVVYKPKYVDHDLKFDESERTVPSGQDPVVFAVNAYLDEAGITPNDARLRSCRVENGLATFDFTPAFAQTYGTDDERTLLEGILTVAGQFEEIRTVRFLADGQPIETLGNVELTDPQPVLRP